MSDDSHKDHQPDQYRDNRDVSRSAKPNGGAGKRLGAPVYVIHKHDAKSLHYDLRLEVDGMLKSWALPKGPSTDPRQKRLAVATKDHPLDYAEFEGVIPEGEYGGGTVLIWDRGTYKNITTQDERPRRMDKALADGHALVWLDGKKISGGYALQRINDNKGQWLLIKMDDKNADARRNPVSTKPDSVASGRSIDEIAKDEGR